MEMKLPFDAPNQFKLYSIIANTRHPRMSKLYSRALRGAVDRMLTKVWMGKEKKKKRR
jgi:hypothetical protein